MPSDDELRRQFLAGELDDAVQDLLADIREFSSRPEEEEEVDGLSVDEPDAEFLKEALRIGELQASSAMWIAALKDSANRLSPLSTGAALSPNTELILVGPGGRRRPAHVVAGAGSSGDLAVQVELQPQEVLIEGLLLRRPETKDRRLARRRLALVRSSTEIADDSSRRAIGLEQPLRESVSNSTSGEPQNAAFTITYDPMTHDVLVSTRRRHRDIAPLAAVVELAAGMQKRRDVIVLRLAEEQRWLVGRVSLKETAFTDPDILLCEVREAGWTDLPDLRTLELSRWLLGNRLASAPVVSERSEIQIRLADWAHSSDPADALMALRLATPTAAGGDAHAG